MIEAQKTKRKKSKNLLEDVPALIPETATDEELLLRAIEQPGLFAYLVERYQDAFMRKAESIIHSKEEAEDIVQETFTKIYVNARRFKPVDGATFKSWGYKILVNTTFTHYQKLKKKGASHIELDPEFYETLPDAVSRHDEEVMRDYVASFLSRLPSQLARPLELHFLFDYSQKEIADMEGSTVSAVKTKIYRAKREFERLLTSDQQGNG
jgi:RNA polymerase sigma-70 factor (ECF subfamily)